MPATETTALDRLDVARARISPAVFIDEHCWLRPAGGGWPQRFRLWDFQGEVVQEIEQRDRIIFLKARQLGLSWLVLAYALWLCSSNHGQTVLIINRNLREAKKLLRRVKFMWQRLPAELREPLGIDSTEELEFPRMDSRIVSLPATEDTGSGESATLVIVDEWAKIPRAPQILTALLPTLSAHGTKLVGISTAKGYHNHYGRTWRAAVDGTNAYYPLFVPCTAHPDRDDAWREQKRREYDTDRDFLQENPETPRDAFQLPGDATFDEFDRLRHARLDERNPDSPWPVWRGVDFGYHYSPVYWIEVQADRTAYVFDELDAQQLTTDELAAEILARDRHWQLDTSAVPAGVDPAGKARTSQSGTDSDHVTLQAHGIRVSFHEPPVPKDRVKLIKRLLREERLFVDTARCPFLAEALEQAEWDLATVPHSPDQQRYARETYRKDGYYEHPLDALGYALVKIFPPRGTAAAARGSGAAAVASQTRRYGGPNYG